MYGARSSKDMGLYRENQSIFLSSMVRSSSNIPPENRNRFIFETCFVIIDYIYGDCLTASWSKHVANL